MSRALVHVVAGLLGISIGAVGRSQEKVPHEVHAAQRRQAALDPAQEEALERIRAALVAGDRERARGLLRETVEGLGAAEEGGGQARLRIILALDGLAAQLGSLEEQRRLRERALAIRARLLPADHPDLLNSKQDLAETLRMLGDLAGANELYEEVLAARTRLLPPDHLDLLRAKGNLAVTRQELGDLVGARELGEEVLAGFARQLPPDHPDLLKAKEFLAVTRWLLGDVAGAHEIFEEVLAARTSKLSPDHPDLLIAKQNLALARRALGNLAGARELEEEVLEARTRLLPPDHPNLLAAKQNLGATRFALGDIAGAQGLFEDVLEAYTRLLPPNHPELLRAKLNLAQTRAVRGDLYGARELEEEVLEARKSLLRPDHPDLLAVKASLAATRRELGDLAGARELEQEVLEVRTRLLPADHPDLLRMQGNLAATLYELGDFEGARDLFEQEVAGFSGVFPPDHPDLLIAKGNLAATRFELGELAGASELFEEVLEARTRLLPADHPDLLTARQSLAVTREALGDHAGACELVRELLDGMRLRAAALRTEAARPAREGARAELRRLSKALSLCAWADPEGTLDAELFATLESLRFASVSGAEFARALAKRSELAQQASDLGALRARLSELATRGPASAEEPAVEDWRRELVRAAEERDRAERALRARLAEAGACTGEIDAARVGERLGDDAAAVSFLRYRRITRRDRSTRETPKSVEALLAFVVRPGGEVARVELGEASELESLVAAWRDAVGEGIGRGRALTGIGGSTSEESAGTTLRARLLDPVLAAAGGVRELYVVPDDLVFLVPLDALPLDGETRVGDRIAILVQPTLAQLLRERRPGPPRGSLVVAGGVDYSADTGTEAWGSADADGAEVGSEAAESDRTESSKERVIALAAAPPLTRSGPPASFPPLHETQAEAFAIAHAYRKFFGTQPAVLQGAHVTKTSLGRLAPGARYLHLATHGWFASEAIKSELDSQEDRGAHQALLRAEESVKGFAPETLCGLALAGANAGADALGRVPGVLTAEELSSMDLSHCELAVLSACETNVGIRRAGQGIQSLQTALHAAGARTAITSLWRVDDAATRRLFELFYEALWRDGVGEQEALWRAKTVLRREGHPVRDWAGWVLSGDPQ